MKTNTSAYDVLIIGSGVAGLAAGTILAQNGINAAIVEKSPLVAPLLSRFKRENVWCDPGFHYIGGLCEDSSFTLLLKYLQVYDRFELEAMDQSGFDIINLKGREYRIPYGLDNLQAYLAEEFPASAGAIRLLIEKIRSIFSTSPLFNPDLEFSEGSLYLNEEYSLREYLLSIGAEEELIELLSAHGVILADASAAEIPFVFYTYILGSYYTQAHTLRRGGDAVVQAFKTRLEELGVPVFTRSEVKAILSDEQKQVQGVRLADERVLKATNIISTIHPQLLLDILPARQLKPIYINRLKEMENTSAPFAAFFDIGQVPEKLKKANYYQISSSKSDNDISNIAFMNLHQDTDPRNKKSFTVFCYCPDALREQFFELAGTAKTAGDKVQPAAYENLKREITAQIEKQIFSTFPELKDKIKHLTSATPVTYERYTGTVKGSIYGARQTVRQRAQGTRGRLRGLYLAGQSLMPGVLGSIVSSLYAAAYIAGYENIWKGIKACR
jgi:all-trans-retinol 13,14-reductase